MYLRITSNDTILEESFYVNILEYELNLQAAVGL